MRFLDSARRAPRTVAAVGLGLGVLAVAWEIARPSLPVPFELGIAMRAPGAATWVGRGPMAVASVVGMCALYMFLRSGSGSGSGAGYGVAVLATMPAWFLHGRTMTGAIGPMAAAVIVLAGLADAVLEEKASRARRALGAAIAIAAVLAAVVAERFGMPGRGILVVAAVPMIAIGGAGVIWRRAGVVEIGVIGAGLLIVLLGAAAYRYGPESRFADVLLGARAVGAGPRTFDAPVAALAYGLVPWTPLAAFAIARRPTSVRHLAVMIAAVLAIAAHAALAPRSGAVTFVGVAFVAGAVAMMLRSLEDAPRPSTALVASILALAWLVGHDVSQSPDRVLVAFGAAETAMPAAQANASSLAIRSSIFLCAVLASFALITPRSWLPTGRGLAIVAGGVFAGLVLRAHAYPEILARLSPGAAFDAWAQRHRAGEPLGLVGLDRRTVAFAPGTAIVPQNDGPTAGRWLAAPAAPATTPSLPSPSPRRFLALAAAELPRVNAEYRAAYAQNVPVLAGQEGATLLAVSALAPGEHSTNPLDVIVLGAAPPSLRPLGNAVLDDQLDALGWQLTDDRGRAVEAIPRGSRSAHVRIFTRVRAGAPSIGAHCTFLHVENTPSRFSAEHRDHPYPMTLWRPGDVVVDDFDVKLPAHFHAGSYRMLWGVGVLPCNDDRRMHVTSGENDGHDRVPAGLLEVR